MFLKAKKKRELELACFWALWWKIIMREDWTLHKIQYTLKLDNFGLNMLIFLLAFLPPFFILFHKSQILMRAISGPVGRGCKDVTWQDGQQQSKFFVFFKAYLMAALQHDSKGTEMIHFMIKMQLLLVFYPQKLKKNKVNRMLNPYISELDMKSA